MKKIKNINTQEKNSNQKEIALTMYQEIIENNNIFVKTKGSKFFKSFSTTQQPRATVVGCSDSRFQINMLDSTPENDLFIIRNIGNQFKNNIGSIDYGLNHLNTPLLLIVGHTRCGAIKAALEDKEHTDKELLSLKFLNKEKFIGNEIEQWTQAVEKNIHKQISFCLKRYKEKVLNEELTIIGIIYDLANDLGKGHGKLHTININGKEQR
jgi:carbonic anhydrase